MSRCYYCDKKFYEGESVWHINECAEEYCYKDIESIEDIYNSCIGKELLKCGYTEEFILKLFKSNLEDREIDIFYTEATED